jgi:hypothetical protein
MSKNIHNDPRDLQEIETCACSGKQSVTNAGIAARKEQCVHYDCPICLGSYEVIHSDSEDGTSNSGDLSSELTTSLSRIPILRDECYQLDTCKHIMCRYCLSMYCQSKINDGIVNIPCCYPLETATSERGDTSWSSWRIADDIVSLSDSRRGDSNSIDKTHSNKSRSGDTAICRKVFTDHDLEQIILFSGKVTADIEAFNLYYKYQRFKFDFLHGDSCRRCPKCDTARIFQLHSSDSSSDTSSSPHDIEIQEELPEDDTSSSLCSLSSTEESLKQTQKTPITPIVNCLECGTEFCYFHSNAHPSRTCEEYEKELEQKDEKSAEYLRKHSKCCPKCGMNVQKIEGCNQMQCPKCQTYFCWLCLAIVDDGMFPAHFQWWNISGCPNLQMHEEEDLSPRAMCLTRVVSLIQIIIIGVPSLALTCVTVMICPCCFFGESQQLADQRMQRCFSMWGNMLTACLLAPFIFACAVISFFIFLVKAMVKGLLVLLVKFNKFVHYVKEAAVKAEESGMEKNESNLEESKENGLECIHNKSSIALNDTLSLSCNSEHNQNDDPDDDLENGCDEDALQRELTNDIDDSGNAFHSALDTLSRSRSESYLSASSGSDDVVSTQKSYTIDCCDIVYREL